MTNENLSLFDTIHSQRAIRHFSKKSVSDEALEMILNAANHAPSGGNRQPWRFVVIHDAEIKRRLGQWYLSAWQAATAEMEALAQAYRHGAELAQQMETVPVLILACIDHGEAGTGLGPVTRGRLDLSGRPESNACRSRSWTWHRFNNASYAIRKRDKGVS